MSSSPFHRAPAWQRYARGLAIPASVVLHAGIAWIMLQDHPEPEPQPETWVEMTITESPPPPEPEPEPEPPKPKPKPKPKPEPVEFTETIPEPTPTDRPPEPEKQRRVVQGLSASSFADGAQTGVTAAAGTTLQAAQTDERMTIEEASTSTAVPYSAATKAPRRRSCPQLQVPDTVKDAGLEGTVKAVLDIGVDGTVTAVRITAGLTPEADAACVTMFRGCAFRPGMQGDAPVAVTNLPQRCRFKAIE